MGKPISNFKNGWDANDSADTRRAMILKMHGGNELEAISELRQISIIAAEDAAYLNKQYQGRNRFKNRMLNVAWAKGLTEG